MNAWASPAVRVLAVLASASLVVAFTFATMMPPTSTLAQLITRFSPGGVAALEGLVTSGLSEWAWQSIALPILARPCWLMPIDFALVFGGMAATIALRRARSAERRRG